MKRHAQYKPYVIVYTPKNPSKTDYYRYSILAQKLNAYLRDLVSFHNKLRRSGA